jgi:hypothetical protein
MHYNSPYKEIIQAKKRALFDPALTPEQRSEAARSHILEIDQEPSWGMKDAVSFAVPFAAVAAFAHHAINKSGLNAARQSELIQYTSQEIEDIANNVVSAVNSTQDLGKTINNLFGKLKLEKTQQDLLLTKLNKFRNSLKDAGSLKGNEVADLNDGFSKNIEIFREIRRTVKHSIDKGIAHINDLHHVEVDERIASIDANFPGGVKGAAVVAATLAGAVVMIGLHVGEKQFKEELRQEIKTELSFVEMENLRRDVNAMKAAAETPRR